MTIILRRPNDLQVPDLVILDKSEIVFMEVDGFKLTTGVSSAAVLRHDGGRATNEGLRTACRATGPPAKSQWNLGNSSSR